jgi:hypothetical protein
MAAVNNSMHAYMHAPQRAQAAAPAASTATTATAQNTDSDGFSFGDFLDIVNPLQHIPVVSTIYRKITGDEIKTPEKIAGDTLYGGLMGFVSSVADSAFAAITGKSVGDTVMAWLDGDDDDAKTQVAAADTAKPAAAPKSTAVTASLRQPDQRALAAAAPTLLTAAEPQPTPAATVAPPARSREATVDPTQLTGAEALMAALRDAKLDPELARRAAFAYNRATDLTQPLPANALPDARLLTP